MRRAIALSVRGLLGLLILLGLVVAPTEAGTFQWNGGGGNDFWTTGPNWGGTAPNPAGDDDLHFAGSTRLGPVTDVAFNVKTITYDPGAGAFVNTGSQITIDGGPGNSIVNNSTNIETINNAIVLNLHAQTFDAASGNLVFGGTVDNGGNALTLTTASGKTITMNGAVSGTGAANISGAGMVIFAANNGYSGTTTIDVGNTLQIATGGTLNGGGPITDNGTLQFNSSGNLTISGAISGSGTVQQTGSGTTILNAASTYTGATTVSAGILRAGVAGAFHNGNDYIVNGGTLDLNNFDVTMSSLSGTGGTVSLGSANLILTQGTNQTYGGMITGTGTLRDSGAGTLILAGNNSYTGTTTIDAGSTIQVGNGGSTGSLGTGIVQDTGHLVFDLGTAGTVSNQIGGTGDITQEGSGTITFTGTNSYSGNTTINSGSTLQVGNGGATGDLGMTAAIHDNGTLIINRDTSAAFTISAPIDGTGNLTQAGTGTTILGAANTYGGSTTINQGTLQLGVDNALPNTTAVTLGNATGNTNGTLDLNGHVATVTGLTTAGTGTANTVTNNGSADATLTFTTGTSTFNGIISDGSTNKTALTVSSGSLSLGGANTYTGNTTVSGGTLTIASGGSTTSNATISGGTMDIEGMVTGNVTNNSGGTLTLNGTATGTVMNMGTMTASSTGKSGPLTNSGTLTLSDTTGLMTVTGDFHNTSTGVVNITVNGTATSGINASGMVTIDGGTLNVDTTNAILNTKYDFLKAGSPITGSDFTTVTPSGTMNFVLAKTGRDDDEEFFILESNFISAAQTQNERAVARYLDAIAPNASGDLSTIISDLQGLTPEQAAAALEQMSGDIHGTLGQLDIQGSTLSVQRLARHLRGGAFAPCGQPLVADDDRASKSGLGAPVQLVCCNEDGTPEFADAGENCVHWTGWVDGFGLGGNARTDGNAPGVNYNMGGTIAGLERWVDDCHLVGFYAGYTGINVPMAVSEVSSINGGQVGGYFMADDGFSYYTVIGGFQFDRFDVHRPIDFTGTDTVAGSDYTGWQTVWYAERGFSFQGCNQLVQPFVALQYDFLRQNDFAESGAGSIDLAGAGVDTNSLRSILGARAQMAIFSRNGRRFLPELHAMWIHEYLDSNSLVNAHFIPTVAGSSGFTVQGLDFGRDWALAGTNFTWEMSDGCSLFVAYDCQANSRQVAHIGSGGIGFNW